MAYARKQYGTTKIKGKARVDGPVEIVVDSANGLVGVKLTSGSTWAPTTGDIVVGVWVEA